MNKGLYEETADRFMDSHAGKLGIMTRDEFLRMLHKTYPTEEDLRRHNAEVDAKVKEDLRRLTTRRLH